LNLRAKPAKSKKILSGMPVYFTGIALSEISVICKHLMPFNAAWGSALSAISSFGERHGFFNAAMEARQ
jgi:hypothetical protein